MMTAHRPPHIPVVAGAAASNFGRFVDTSLVDIAAPVVREAIKRAGITTRDLQAAFVGNAFAGGIIDQESILAQVLLSPCGLTGIPMRTVKNACSSGADAMHLAWSAVAYGQYDCVLVLGAEKLTHTDKLRAFKALATATDHPSVDAGRSVFMDVNAQRALKYMESYGAKVQHFAHVAVKNRQHALLNERAAVREVITIDDVLADREVVAPLTRAMCSGIVDGAACVVLMNSAFAAQRGITGASRIVASASVSGIPADSTKGNATHRAGVAAYEQAGIDPRGIHVAEVHDASAPQELFDIEDLLFCERGMAIELLDRGDLALGGRIPVNTSGGLTSRGHPVGATGVVQIVEIDEQLQQRAGARQVANARVGLTQMAGGLLGNDSAIASVHILTV